MIERDYIKRSIDRFLEELNAKLNSITSEEKEAFLSDISIRYFGLSILNFVNLSYDELIEKYNTKELELVVKLLSNYNESNIDLMNRCILLLNYIDKNSDIFSFERHNEIIRLKKRLINE